MIDDKSEEVAGYDVLYTWLIYLSHDELYIRETDLKQKIDLYGQTMTDAAVL